MRKEHMRLPISVLKADPHNPRKIGAAARTGLSVSLETFGALDIVFNDETGELVSGHQRVDVLKAAGATELVREGDWGHIAHPVTGERFPVRFVSWDETKQRMANLAANNPAIQGDFTDAALAQLMEVQCEAGFEDLQLSALMRELSDGSGSTAETGGETAGNCDPDSVPDPPAEPVSKRGDVWLLGEHRLCCGDSTNAQDVARLMATSAADIVFTSPPYGQQRDYGETAVEHVREWDALMNGVFGAMRVKAEAQVLVNLGLIHRGEWLPYWEKWIEWMRSAGWKRFGWYVWDQGPGLPGDWNGRLAPAFEFIFHFCKQPRQPKKTKACSTAGQIHGDGGLRQKDGKVGQYTNAGKPVQDRKIPDSVVRVCRSHGGAEFKHPAMFPAELPKEILAAYSNEGAVVYEPFSGSGTTIIAAEQMGRRCWAMELEPRYVDVAVARWERFAGKKAVKADG